MTDDIRTPSLRSLSLQYTIPQNQQFNPALQFRDALDFVRQRGLRTDPSPDSHRPYIECPQAPGGSPVSVHTGAVPLDRIQQLDSFSNMSSCFIVQIAGKLKVPYPTYTYEKSGPEHRAQYRATVHFAGWETSGDWVSNKPHAQETACRNLIQLFGLEEKMCHGCARRQHTIEKLTDQIAELHDIIENDDSDELVYEPQMKRTMAREPFRTRRPSTTEARRLHIQTKNASTWCVVLDVFQAAREDRVHPPIKEWVKIIRSLIKALEPNDRFCRYKTYLKHLDLQSLMILKELVEDHVGKLFWSDFKNMFKQCPPMVLNWEDAYKATKSPHDYADSSDSGEVSSEEAPLQDVGMLGSGNSKGDGPSQTTSFRYRLQSSSTARLRDPCSERDYQVEDSEELQRLAQDAIRANLGSRRLAQAITKASAEMKEEVLAAKTALPQPLRSYAWKRLFNSREDALRSHSSDQTLSELEEEHPQLTFTTLLDKRPKRRNSHLTPRVVIVQPGDKLPDVSSVDTILYAQRVPHKEIREVLASYKTAPVEKKPYILASYLEKKANLTRRKRRDAKTQAQEMIYQTQMMGGMRNAWSSAKDWVSKLKTNIGEGAQNIADLTKQAKEGLSSMQESILRAGSSFMGAMRGGMSFFLHVIPIAIVGALILWAWHQAKKGLLRVLAIILGLIMSAMVVDEFCNRTLQRLAQKTNDRITHYITAVRQGNPSPSDCYQPQSDSMTKSVGKLIATALSAVMIGRCPEGKRLEKIASCFEHYEKLREGSADVAHVAIEALQEIVNKVGKWFGWPYVQWVNTGLPEVDSWIDDVQNFAEGVYKEQIKINTHTGETLETMRRRGVELHLQCTKSRATTSVASTISVVLQRIKDLAGRFEHANVRMNKPRMVPLTIVVRGESGVGKSTMTFPVLIGAMYQIAKINGDKEMERYLEKDMYAAFYSRAIEQQYWDGYIGQFVTVYDDLYQAKVDGGKDSEAMELIRLAQMWPASLHVAELSLKGSTFFKSEIIFCTTNQPNNSLAASQITHVPALDRRFEIDATLSCSREFALNTNCDAKKWVPDKKKLEGGVFDPRVPLFYVRGHENPLTFWEFVSLITEAYFARKKQAQQYIGSLEDMRKEMKERAEGAHKAFFERKAQEALDSPLPVERPKTDPEHEKVMVANGFRKRPKDCSLDEGILLQPIEPSSEYKPQMFQSRNGKLPSTHMEAVSAASHAINDSDSFIARNVDEKGYKFYDGTKVPSEKEARYTRAMDWATTPYNTILDEFDWTQGSGPGLTLPNMELPPWASKLYVRGVRFALFYNRIADVHLPRALVAFSSAAMSVWHLINAKYPASSPELLADKVAAFRNFMFFELPEFDLVQALDLSMWEQTKRQLVSIKDTLAQKFQAFKKAHPIAWTILKWAPIVLGAIAGAFALTSFFRSVDTAESYEEQSVHRPPEQARRSRLRSQRPLKPQFHVNTFDNTANDTANVIRLNNLWHLDTVCGQVNAFFVKDCMFLIPRHAQRTIRAFLEQEEEKYEDDYLCKITDPHTGKTFEFSVHDVLDGVPVGHTETNDAVLVRMKSARNFPPRRDFTDRFVTRGDMARIKREEYDCLMVLQHPGSPGFINTLRDVRPMDEKEHAMMGSGAEAFTLRNGYKYYAATKDGSCSSPLLIMDNTTRQRKIIGIHVGGGAGNGSSAVAASVFQEDLIQAIKELEAKDPEKPYSVSESSNPEYKLQAFPTPGGNAFAPVTVLKTPVRVGTKTAIIESPIARFLPWEQTKAPAVLHKIEVEGKIVDPYEMSLAKYTQNNPVIPLGPIQAACHDLYAAMTQACTKPSLRRVLTDEEAICGIEGHPIWGSIGRGTSAGFIDTWADFAHLIGPDKPGKTLFFGTGDKYDLNNPYAKALLDRVHSLEDRMSKGIRDLHVWKDFLKDELLKLEKVKNAKTRFISPAPLDLTVMFRKYFGAFCVFMQEGKIDNGSAIGANPYNADWHAMWQRLAEKGHNYLDGDFGEYDTRFLTVIMWEFCAIANAYYGDKPGSRDYTIRQMLMLEIMNSRHVAGKSVFEWMNSEPSGNPLTAFINTFYTLVLVRLVWMIVNSPPGEIQERHIITFRKNVFAIALGDDHVISVSPEAAKVMNPKRIAEALTLLGQRYTNADKTEPTEFFRPREQLSFLKRGFRVEPILDRIVAPLDLQTIRESIRWTRKGEDYVATAKETFHTMVLELSLHGREVFQRDAPLMFEAYRSAYGLHYPYQNWLTVLHEVSSSPYYTGPAVQL